MQYPRICLCAMLVCLFSCFGTVMGQDTIDLKSLADSVRKANGKPNFLPLGMHFLELAKERKDTANISDAYAILASHYYELGDTDSLRLVNIWTGQIVATVIPIAIRHGGSTSSE